MNTCNSISNIYTILLDHFGPQQWWPADSTLEMMVGAVLTQNTNWKNVEKAIHRLKEAELLSFDRLRDADVAVIADLIRPAGYYNLKAKRLKNLIGMVEHKYNCDLQSFMAEELSVARENLLGVKGVGEETADSILLYACNKPIFVVDTYTHRVFSRHNLVPEECGYSDVQELFMDCLEPDNEVFNEYHALIVKVAKEFCKKKKPLCHECPLDGL